MEKGKTIGEGNGNAQSSWGRGGGGTAVAMQGKMKEKHPGGGSRLKLSDYRERGRTNWWGNNKRGCRTEKRFDMGLGGGVFERKTKKRMKLIFCTLESKREKEKRGKARAKFKKKSKKRCGEGQRSMQRKRKETRTRVQNLCLQLTYRNRSLVDNTSEKRGKEEKKRDLDKHDACSTRKRVKTVARGGRGKSVRQLRQAEKVSEMSRPLYKLSPFKPAKRKK